MCGIAGFLSARFNQSDLVKMTDTLVHRGPDAGGYYYDAATGIGLGHRRLSIIDLSEAANQPFWSADRRYCAVFNGEVYNYRELSKKYNLTTRTNGDTEVVLEMFARFGADAAKEWNGMFALMVWDTQTQTLSFFRDRMGKKPLYYYWDGKDFAFASELKALRSLMPLENNPAAIADFLYLGYLPGALTIHKKVFRLLPGYSAVISNGQLTTTPYWQPQTQIQKEYKPFESFDKAKAELKTLLEEAVAYRMISDVPLGTFLSGGTDSSVVTAIAQSLSSTPVKTFSIGFTNNKFNEADYARKVAQHLGTDHHEFMLSPQEAMEKVELMASIYDEPFSDTSAVPTQLVSAMARKHVTVALSGDGGDELFMGYGMYSWAERLSNPMLRLLRTSIAFALSHSGKNRLKRAATVFQYKDAKRVKSHIFSQEQYLFSEQEIAQLLLPGIPHDIVLDENLSSLPRHLSASEQQALFDMRFYLPDDLLVKVDRASMKHSLEVRCPLLDYRVVEWALNLPQQWKVQGGVQKYILKEVLYDYVPREYFDRPKWGFGIPLGDWLKKDLRYLIDTYLSPETLTAAGLVNPAAVATLVDRFFKDEDYLYNRLWALVVLHR